MCGKPWVAIIVGPPADEMLVCFECWGPPKLDGFAGIIEAVERGEPVFVWKHDEGWVEVPMGGVRDA